MSDPFLGEVKIFAGNFAPRGWATCDGQLIPISQNTALFALLGVNFGGDGRTTFSLPDLRARMPMHAGQGPGLSPHSVGETGGSTSVTLLQSEIPQHTHTLHASPAASTTSPGGSATLAVTSGTKIYAAPSNLVPMGAGLQAAGGNQPHENRQPFLGVTFIIALQGIFPARN